MKKQLVIFTDIGDTVIDESTELRDQPFGVVKAAKCIPGAKETMRTLYDEGYTIVMVADGLEASFHNTMQENGLSDIFSAWVISECVGCEKPDPRMFETAMQSVHLRDEDKRRVIMVGNNLSRDIVGANRFGITSVHLSWSPRYPSMASCQEEAPAYQIAKPQELLGLVETLERKLSSEAIP